MTNENKRHLFNGLLVVGYWLLVAGLDCPVTRVTQWLAGAHETGILTDNQQPTTNNQQPPPTNACGRSRGHASEQGDRSYEARPIFPFRGSDQPFGYPIPRAFA